MRFQALFLTGRIKESYECGVGIVGDPQKPTKKGDDVSERLLRELIAYEEFANLNKTDSDEPFKIKKGVKSGVVYDPGLQRVEKGWQKRYPR